MAEFVAKFVAEFYGVDPCGDSCPIISNDYKVPTYSS